MENWRISKSLDPIPNRISARPALLEATYFDSLMYLQVDLDLNEDKTRVISFIFVSEVYIPI